ncbi:MAG: hypothetical protein WD065_08080 [Planctomycetaceae bacterium]
MPINFECHSCGNSLRAVEEMAGRKAKCPECNALLVVPSPIPPVGEQALGLAQRPQRNEALSNADMQAVLLSAQRLADIIFESMKIARDSKNQKTKISRLDLAKEKLEELKRLAVLYPRLQLSNLEKFETSLSQLDFECQDVEHAKAAKESVGLKNSDGRQHEFWAEKVRRLKRQGDSEEAICEAGKNIPYPGAFREIAVAIRKDIRARRKQKVEAKNLLLKLYRWAVIEDFFGQVNWSEIINERILHSTARSSVKGIKTTYQIIGYDNLAILNKTDVKWLVEEFGEPDCHSTAKDANPDLWHRAVEAFQAAAQRDEQHFWRSHGFDGPP